MASVAVPPAESVTGAELDELLPVVERFLRAYVAGDAGALAYLVPAGVRIATPGPRGYAFGELTALTQAAPPAGRVRQLEVTVRVRDLASGAVFAQLYRLRLERRERWY